MLRKAIAAKPDFGRAWANLGVALASGGDIDAAEEPFRQLACSSSSSWQRKSWPQAARGGSPLHGGPSALRSRACAACPPQCSPRATPEPLQSTATLADLTAFDHPGNAVSFEPTARNWVNLARLHAAKGQSALANDAMGKAKSLGGI